MSESERDMKMREICNCEGEREQPLFLSFTKVVYGMLHLLVYHQYSLVNEIGPPHKRDTCLITLLK